MANAMPACAIGHTNTRFNSMFPMMLYSPIRVGVCISCLDVKPGTRTLIKIKANKPKAKLVKLLPAIITSPAPNSLYWNKVDKMGSASNTKPNVAGNPMSSTNFSPQSNDLEKAIKSSVAWFFDRLGNITVATATPSMPNGNSTKRSE